MNESEKDELINSWIEGQAGGTGSDVEKKNWWAIELMMELPWDDPELTWELIVRIHNSEHSSSEEVRGVLAAGPLEDLMEQHGKLFIDRVEELARIDPDFRGLMRSVWLAESEKNEWQRFYKAAGIPQPAHLKGVRGV